jgi:hypothetical protein
MGFTGEVFPSLYFSYEGSKVPDRFHHVHVIEQNLIEFVERPVFDATQVGNVA